MSNQNTEYKIIEISDGNILELQDMADEATFGGDSFIQKTIVEWRSGSNKFNKIGEKLWGLAINNQIVGVGGLNRDPYIDDSKVGRVRHVYILKKYRGCGLSKVLLQLIIDLAKEHYKVLRLSTTNPVAASLYKSLGFEKVNEYKATHVISDLDSI